jgi:long-subunit fatty acid transport protein
LGFIYQPNDRLSFNIVPKRPNVSYKLNDKLTVFAEAGMSYEEYEVTKDDLKNVVLRFKEDRLGTGIKYKFNKFIESSVTVGGVFNRSLKYRDSLGKVDIKSGFYSEFRVEIKI